MFAEVVLGAAGHDVGQLSGAGGGNENIGDLILAAEFHCRTQYFAGLDFQMTENLGLFAAKQDMNFLFELQQWDMDPPTFIAGMCDDRRPMRIALIKQRAANSPIDAFDGFTFDHVFSLDGDW
ncbi:MAG: hypothetical protein HHJ09_13370 [Glaciimonas sp.]|nr:hypothetical protein [Glaciimonas sp.]